MCGRFSAVQKLGIDKSFPIQTDEYFYQVARYVERNALRADLVAAAEEWRWSSLWRRVHGSGEQVALLRGWPLPRPRNWKSLVSRSTSARSRPSDAASGASHHSAASRGWRGSRANWGWNQPFVRRTGPKRSRRQKSPKHKRSRFIPPVSEPVPLSSPCGNGWSADRTTRAAASTAACMAADPRKSPTCRFCPRPRR